LFPKTAVQLQAIETAGRPRAAGFGFFKNSLLIPLLPQIAKRFQRGVQDQRRKVSARAGAAGQHVVARQGDRHQQ
jgi:hypothetical protein